jgi:hypothetical protein
MKQQTKAADDWVALVFYQEKEVYYENIIPLRKRVPFL